MENEKMVAQNLEKEKQEEQSNKEKIITYKNDNFKSKLFAFILIMIFVLNGVVSIFSAIYLVDTNAYDKGKEQYLKEEMGKFNYELLGNIEHVFLNYRQFNTEKEIEMYFDNIEENSIDGIKFSIENKAGDILFNNYKNAFQTKLNYSYLLKFDVFGNMFHISEEDQNINELVLMPGEFALQINTYLDPSAKNEQLHFTYHILMFLYEVKYVIWINILLSIIFAFLLYLYLLRKAGRRNGSNEVYKNFLSKIPLEIYLLVVFVIGVVPVAVAMELNSFRYGNFSSFIATAMVTLLMIVLIYTPLALEFSMNIAVRIKSKTLFKNMIITKAINLPINLIKYGCNLLSQVKISIRMIVIFSLFILVDMAIIILSEPYINAEFLMIMWSIRTIVLGVVILYLIKNFQVLHRGIKNIANGNFDTQIDTKNMIWEIKKHGQYMNHINIGMEEAVNRRMKSERMKTELLTNVSHDIKTPLTSIINYTDLLGKEEIQNEKAKEYVDVLSRQSQRLKVFIDDLVEASKAATGNLDVKLAPCDLKVLIDQTKGEYEEKVKEKNLEMIAAIPKENISIMADPKLLQRVFDNLMNNIYKYSQENTRVYINVEEDNENATIILKNTSKFPLNISAEELVERFVRGDKSRNTEGSGLGLSIAKNLTNLQKGSLDIAIDGDLFKVILTFPKNFVAVEKEDEENTENVQEEVEHTENII